MGSSLYVVVLGMPCAFTWNVVSAATARNTDEPAFEVQSIILAGEQEDATTGCADPGPSAGAPIETVASRSAFTGARFREQIMALAPDVIVVACFPWRVPRSIRDIPRFGCINVHPSLLPDGRGPEPVFWAFRRGQRTTGVTIHRMDDGLDTGPILAQEVVEIGADATIVTLEARLAEVGGRVLHAGIRDLAPGLVRERKQPPGPWLAAPFPSRQNLVATTEWSATHVARFIRAVAPVYGPVPIRIVATGRNFPRPIAAGDVIAADDRATQVDALAWDGDTVGIRCTLGVVTVRMPRQASPLVLHGRDTSW